MASEMLKAVLEAEKKCSQKEADARKQAELDKRESLKKCSKSVNWK